MHGQENIHVVRCMPRWENDRFGRAGKLISVTCLHEYSLLGELLMIYPPCVSGLLSMVMLVPIFEGQIPSLASVIALSTCLNESGT